MYTWDEAQEILSSGIEATLSDCVLGPSVDGL